MSSVNSSWSKLSLTTKSLDLDWWWFRERMATTCRETNLAAQELKVAMEEYYLPCVFRPHGVNRKL